MALLDYKAICTVTILHDMTERTLMYQMSFLAQQDTKLEKSNVTYAQRILCHHNSGACQFN